MQPGVKDRELYVAQGFIVKVSPDSGQIWYHADQISGQSGGGVFGDVGMPSQRLMGINVGDAVSTANMGIRIQDKMVATLKIFASQMKNPVTAAGLTQ
jgi:hypothetical protein